MTTNRFALLLALAFAYAFLVLGILTAHGQTFAGRNQSCATKACDPHAAPRLYCTTDATPPYDGPATGGTCKECAGSTWHATKCATGTTLVPSATTTTVRPTTTLAPGGTTTTTKPPAVTTTTTAPQGTTTTLPVLSPIRPNGGDMTVAFRDPSENLRWFPLSGMPHTASQAEKDALEWALLERAVRTVSLFESDPALRAVGKQTLSYCVSNLNAVTARLCCDYEARALCKATCDNLPIGSGGVWDVPYDGRHYSITINCITRAAETLLRAPEACARLLGHDTDSLRLYGLTITDGRCVRAPRELPPLPAYDAKRAMVGLVDSRVRMPKPTGADLHALHATHAAHLAVSDWRCGVGPAPPAGVVATTHVLFEATARSEAELAFRRMKDFSGVVDPKLAPGDVCRWARVQDAKHERWMHCEEAGDVGCAREAASDHLLAHICMNIGATRPDLLVLFSCGNGRSILNCQWPNGKRGKLTCAQALDVLAPM